MKTMTLLSVLATTFAAPLAALADTSFTGRSYVKTARFEHPLDTYDACSPHSYAGAEARETAIREALLACRADFASDCVIKGTSFRAVMSREFIGYKYCEAKVTVVGFLLRR